MKTYRIVKVETARLTDPFEVPGRLVKYISTYQHSTGKWFRIGEWAVEHTVLVELGEDV